MTERKKGLLTNAVLKELGKVPPPIKVEIPQMYLLHIAATGKMGSGELMTLVRDWAQKACIEAGLEKKLKKEQMENIAALKKQMINIVGEKKWAATMAHLEKLIKGK